MSNKNPSPENRFTPDNQPDNRGRKPSRLKEYIENNNLSSTDIANTIKYIFPMTEGELDDLANNKEKPILMRLFVKAILRDMENSNTYNIMQLFNRAFGQPKQEIEHTGNEEKPLRMVSIKEIMQE